MPPLNAVLEKFKDWPYPTLMLVGNHDQVPAVWIILPAAYGLMLVHT